MALISGCQEGKKTPRLVEVYCPKCHEVMEVFVNMGGRIGETGCTNEDETCECGYVIGQGTNLDTLTIA